MNLHQILEGIIALLAFGGIIAFGVVIARYYDKQLDEQRKDHERRRAELEIRTRELEARREGLRR